MNSKILGIIVMYGLVMLLAIPLGRYRQNIQLRKHLVGQNFLIN
jgi:hypothetical protein